MTVLTFVRRWIAAPELADAHARQERYRLAWTSARRRARQPWDAWGASGELDRLRKDNHRLRAELRDSNDWYQVKLAYSRQLADEVQRLQAALAATADPRSAKRIADLERELARLRRFCTAQENRLARAEGRPEQALAW